MGMQDDSRTFKRRHEDALKAKAAHTPEDVLALARVEATKFGRCCDLYQDSFGTFADHECQQRTFAMLHGVQRVLGVDTKNGAPLTAEEAAVARKDAIMRRAAPELYEALDAITSYAESALAQFSNGRGALDISGFHSLIKASRAALSATSEGE